ncbi:type IV pilus twitching motility protein PilT [Gimesia aquarii]|uniref:Twitching mobility protein n=1 Tax=Gimesia aquarii TaxID=2527964 RepID=A0A517WZM4_9PLAN|nr:PilT/PilU family type 4a pilus ATPase [Gimesia aquarii]QDU10705.1 Twitching mobility protein [Gimesia aquarii]
MSWTLEKILKGARSFKASDIHLVRGLSPSLRINGDIRPLEGHPLLKEDLLELYNSIMNEKQKKFFEEHWQICFSEYTEGIGRYRVSVYYHSGVPEFSIRLCESDVRTKDELGLPPVIDELTRIPSGLILVTGPTGMGKTTTLNYMIHSINQQRRAKIVTIEDPVEYTHDNIRSIIIQQEVLGDVLNFQSALRHVLRQDPDVIVIGEMRDLETIETALIAAETGHLVIATLHTPDSVQTIQRIYSVFPAEQQNSITVQLANSIQAIISQKLLPHATGSERLLACEVCIATSAIRNHIRERQVHHIYSEIQTGRKFQMKTMDQILMELYQSGDITYDVAISNAREPKAIMSASATSSAGEFH